MSEELFQAIAAGTRARWSTSSRRARAGALGAAGTAGYAPLKRARLRPVLDRIDTPATEAWLDTWFSDEGHQRLRAAVARITKES